MDQNCEIINEFESILKERSSKKPLPLYASNEHENNSQDTCKTGKIYSAKEVLANVSKQLKAIQNADTSYKRVGNKLDKYKKREFLPIHMIPVDMEVPQNIPTKFETQCVTDTQLINVIENAEIIDRNRGVTQEFDKTFYQKSYDIDIDNNKVDIVSDKRQDINDVNGIEESKEYDNANDQDTKLFANSDPIFTCEMEIDNNKVDNLKPEAMLDIVNDKRQDLISLNRIEKLEEHDDVNNQDSKLFENSDPITCEMDTITCYQSDIITDLNDENASLSPDTQGFNKCAEIIDVSQVDLDRCTSPVLNTNRRNTASPLVVNLDTFEIFENLAHPIIEEYEDLEVAKNLINSQIIGKEIFIPDHIYENIEIVSPVLNKIESISIHKDDLKAMSASSNKCMHENIKEIKADMYCSQNNIDSDKQKTESKIIKAEIKDEILFSSDEEYEYLHKDVPDLPLTCALQTSFYDKSDILDKTMYVGFQTASNRSIQIHTDSFHKAKSILSDIDNETTLNELVKIFDSGKAVSGNVQSIKLDSTGKEHDTKNQTYCNIEHDDSKDLSKTHENIVEFQETIYDTLKNTSLTALERDSDVNDDIVMSQIIEFKTTSRSAKIDNSIKSKGKINVTFNNVGAIALEQNKEKDEDVPMSQIIEFKSRAKIPKVDNVFCTNINDSNTKRKLEGFKTANNKKIKQSDKALARSKKEFQDIELDDSEDIICKTNSVDTKEDYTKDFKLHNPNISYNGSNANSEIDYTAIERETDTDDSISRLSHVAITNKVKGLSADINVTQKQPKIKDIDLEIDDQIILKEFEDNEMPFVETNNNNAFVGFKTASNKNIAISDEAMTKTKNLFQDIMAANEDSDSHSITKTTGKCTSDGDQYKNIINKPEVDDKKTKRSKEVLAIMKGMIESTPQGEKEDDSIKCEIHKSLTSTFIGFETAANKEIKISGQAIEKSKDFYKHLAKDFQVNSDNERQLNLNMSKHNVNRVDDEFNCGIDTQDFITEELTNIEELFKDHVIENKKPMSPAFHGFQTASRKTVKISDQALAMSKKLFADISNKECDDENLFTSVESVSKCNNNCKKERTNNMYDDLVTNDVESQLKGFQGNVEKKTNELDKIKHVTPIFTGFQTASNKRLTISDKSIEKSKKLFQDIVLFDPKQNNAQNEDETDLNRFPIASDEFTISETLSKHSKNSHDTQITVTTKEDNKGLKCQVKKVDLQSGNRESPIFTGFTTASAKPIRISAETIEKTKKMLSEFDLKDDEIMVDHNYGQTIEPKPSTSTFVGFQTASNKEVKISANALAKSKQMLNDFELKDNFTKIDSSKPNTINSRIEKTIMTISESGLKGDDIMVDNFGQTLDPKPSTSTFVGFQTASNKEIKISANALAKSKQMLNDFVFKDNLNKFDSSEPNSITVKINNGTNKSNTPSKNKFIGFQTASNKEVKISDEALARSKHIFQDVNIHEKDIDICSQKLIEQEGKTTQLKGFQTASNKKVCISEKASENSRKLFQDIDTDDLKEEKHEGVPVFRGFQTANNKKVKISEKALAKSKKLFEDINLSQLDKDLKTDADLDNLLITKVNNDVIQRVQEPLVKRNDFEGFQTASNKSIKVSDRALAITKDMFKDINEEKRIAIGIHKNTKKIESLKVKGTNDATVALETSDQLNLKRIVSKTDKKSKNILDTKYIVDTQVLNDFQDTVDAEDFYKSTPKSKRSGSPILSCPRAKKRKFETPYRSHKKLETKNAFVPPKLAKTYDFNNDYKKHKKYTLKDVERLENEQTKIDIDPYISLFNFDTLLNFEFFGPRNDYTKGLIASEELKKIFLDSVNKKIVPDGWLENHIKLILWKLLSYEVKYPNVMKNICTVRNVLEQLKYRYKRELYHVQRPILRKILEKDEVSSKTMVLCVAAIYVDNIKVDSVTPSSQNVELLLTDGWYCVRACVDRMMIRLLASGALVVGTKIAVCGAELVNCEQGVAPWEDTSSVRLKLSGNSVRRARWLTRLGARTDLIRCPLGAVRADGGRVAAMRVLVTRVYPALYVERMEDGSTVTLSERLEHSRQMKHESEREAIMEKLYEEVEKEMSDLESQDSEGCPTEINLDTGSQLSKCMKKSKDPDEFRSHLTNSQNRMLEEHDNKQRERLIERVRGKFQQKLKETGLKTDRNVVPLLKVRLAGLADKNGVEVTKGYLSIWRPSAAVSELVTEGAWIEVLNIIPTGLRNSEIQLSAGRQTVYNQFKQNNDKFKVYTNILKRKCYEIKEITQNPLMTTDYNEIDTVGMIFSIEPSSKDFDEKQNFQNVYIADADKNIVCVNFWGGLKKFGFENVLDTGQIITCVNLQKRAGNTRKSIPQYRVTEFSYFTKTPKDKKAMEITNELSNKLSKIKEKFCQDCELLRNNYSVFKMRNNENISPYRFDYNVPKNMVSPLKRDSNLNLTGLDFESSFDMDISPQALLRKKKVNEKIEKIRLGYGEPPPLASIHIINKSKNASATYKSPLNSNLERSNVASAETPSLQNVARVKSPSLQNDSPVTVNRTFVKNINPVRLNFSRAANLNDSIDHFAEDFEVSPPLSLDSDIVNS